MEELIEVRNEKGELLVSARDLHEGLEITERFSSWFNRMLQYGFEENVDYTSVKSFTVVHNGAKRELQDYAMKIDMAKEICMLQRNDRGRMYRKYFLDCERKLKEANEQPQINNSLEELLLNIIQKGDAEASEQLKDIYKTIYNEGVKQGLKQIDSNNNNLDKINKTIDQLYEDKFTMEEVLSFVNNNMILSKKLGKQHLYQLQRNM